MNTIPPSPACVDLDAPLTNFSQCHAGIMSQLQAFAGLPALLDAARQARGIAAQTLQMFKRVVLEHHAEEEKDLFPAVLRSAREGEEHDHVQAIALRLTVEHRALESLWKTLESAVKDAAKGKPAELDTAVLGQLVHTYLAHARFEEEEFLPLAETILARNDNHMAALGLSLHMRHMPAKQFKGYI